MIPNTVVLDQVGLKFDLQPNTVQKDHTSFGFLFTSIFGTDYLYTTAKGYFSDQLLKHNNKYGFDPAEAYALVYFPKIADGMILKAGRFISPADIEAQWVPDNYLYSHSLMFTVDPYTFTGVKATFKLGSYWQLEVGAHSGNDVAPWVNSASLNGLLMARWVLMVLHDKSVWIGDTLKLYQGSFQGVHGSSNDATKTGYYLRKLMDSQIIAVCDLNNGYNNWPIIKLTEVYLNYAEAQNEANGPDQSVYDAINAIRQRPTVNMPPLPSGLSQSQMHDRIHHERTIELALARGECQSRSLSLASRNLR